MIVNNTWPETKLQNVAQIVVLLKCCPRREFTKTWSETTPPAKMEEKTNPVITRCEGVGGVAEGGGVGGGGEVTVECVTVEGEGVPVESLDEVLSVSAINCVTLLEEDILIEESIIIDKLISMKMIDCRKTPNILSSS